MTHELNRKWKHTHGRSYPREARYLAAGEFLAMLPAGDMWSVVTLSPRKRRQAASLILVGGGRSAVYRKGEKEREGWRVRQWKQKDIEEE